MNEYEFDYEVADGWYATYCTWASNKLQAYENLLEHLKECGENPEKVIVLNCYVSVAEGEEGNDNT